VILFLAAVGGFSYFDLPDSLLALRFVLFLPAFSTLEAGTSYRGFLLKNAGRLPAEASQADSELRFHFNQGDS